MDVTVALEMHYSVAPDGSVWSKIGQARSFWERYLEVFDRVAIVARAIPVAKPPEGSLRVDGDGIHLRPVTNYQGPEQFVLRYPRVWRSVRAAMPERGAVILRVGSQIADMIEGKLRERNRPFAVEVVSDPYEVFGRGVVDHPLRRYFRWKFTRSLKRQCLGAIGAAYVTRSALQARYPCRSHFSVSDVDLTDSCFVPESTYYSNVELSAESIAETALRVKGTGPYRLITVGTLERAYKATDVLIDAVADCVRSGLDLTCSIIGDGRLRPSLMSRADRLGVKERISFLGWVTAGEPVRRILDGCDLYVMPSKSEGLPRALIEAMARGLPCIGSDVGGIPELLEPEEMVPAGDFKALSRKIQEVLMNPSRMAALSRRNLKVAHEYCDTVLNQRRKKFYEFVRDVTRELEARG